MEKCESLVLLLVEPFEGMNQTASVKITEKTSFISSLPFTSAEKRAECLETNSFSSWSRLQSIRLVSHERIPARQTKTEKINRKTKNDIGGVLLTEMKPCSQRRTGKQASKCAKSHPRPHVHHLPAVHWKIFEGTCIDLLMVWHE